MIAFIESLAKSVINECARKKLAKILLFRIPKFQSEMYMNLRF